MPGLGPQPGSRPQASSSGQGLGLIVVDALKQVLAELDVKTTNFGQVRRALAARLCVTEAALDPWRQQLGDMVQGIL